MGGLEAVTVVSRSHLPYVRLLAGSLADHHSEVRLTVVMVDGDGDARLDHPALRLISPLEMGIEQRELHRRALLYDPQGLISSLRPLAISHLLDKGARSVLLLDADMLVLGALDDLWRLADQHGVVLSPHTLSAREDEVGIRSDERYLLSGTFNGGLLGVGEDGRAFLRWMAARVARDCVRDPARGLLYSQTWLNLVPALFDHHVLRDPGVNVTAHRLAGRDLEGTLTQPRLDGAPVRLFHFTGFDPAAPQTLCRYLKGAYGSLTNRPLLAELCHRYVEALVEHGWPSPTDYGWARLACGLPVDEVMRSLYRGALLASEQGDGKEPPDPFDRHDPGKFMSWLREPSGELSRYLVALRAMRADLRTTFPNVPGADTPAYAQWAKTKAEPDPGAEPDFPAELTSTASRRGNGLRRLLTRSR